MISAPQARHWVVLIIGLLLSHGFQNPQDQQNRQDNPENGHLNRLLIRSFHQMVGVK
jgi:hypothetical protein